MTGNGTRSAASRVNGAKSATCFMADPPRHQERRQFSPHSCGCYHTVDHHFTICKRISTNFPQDVVGYPIASLHILETLASRAIWLSLYKFVLDKPVGDLYSAAVE